MEHHQWERSSDDDNTCLECEVVVDERVLEALMLTCPVRPCPEPSNDGEPCVFVPTEDGGIECAYCGRDGDPHGEYDGSGDLWDTLPEVPDEDDEDGPYQPFG